MAVVDAQIVESPITTAKIVTAMEAARTAIGEVSGPIAISSFNQGRSMLIVAGVNVVPAS